MSRRCTAEEYEAFRATFRISHDDESYVRGNANVLAAYLEDYFSMDGSNITFGSGRWKEDVEFSAAVEIVIPIMPTNQDMCNISEFVNRNPGMSCFATVEPTTAFELYELAE